MPWPRSSGKNDVILKAAILAKFGKLPRLPYFRRGSKVGGWKSNPPQPSATCIPISRTNNWPKRRMRTNRYLAIVLRIFERLESEAGQLTTGTGELPCPPMMSCMRPIRCMSGGRNCRLAKRRIVEAIIEKLVIGDGGYRHNCSVKNIFDCMVSPNGGGCRPAL